MGAVVEAGRTGNQGLLDGRKLVYVAPVPSRTLETKVYEIDPLSDRRWAEMLDRHPRASIYHTPAWLEALKRTYGCVPVAYTTTPPGQRLLNGLVFCRVESWLTGRRIVSLPFSDHCDLLTESDRDFGTLMNILLRDFQMGGWKYTELRPRGTMPQVTRWLQPDKHYCFHSLDLSFGLKHLHSSMHKDCIQRKIRRAAKEGLVYREGRSRELLAIFYRLFIETRRKHGLPPQPFEWFSNLAEALGPDLQVRVALHSGRPVASIITIVHRSTITYKYGCSDPEMANLGGTPWLFWKVIEEATSWGFRELDLGRSDWDNPGLIAFKDRLGARRTPVTYWRFPKSKGVADGLTNGKWQWLAGKFFRQSPAPLLAATGSLLYRHMG
jgi:hypothetical protein